MLPGKFHKDENGCLRSGGVGIFMQLPDGTKPKENALWKRK